MLAQLPLRTSCLLLKDFSATDFETFLSLQPGRNRRKSSQTNPKSLLPVVRPEPVWEMAADGGRAMSGHGQEHVLPLPKGNKKQYLASESFPNLYPFKLFKYE